MQDAGKFDELLCNFVKERAESFETPELESEDEGDLMMAFVSRMKPQLSSVSMHQEQGNDDDEPAVQ